MIEPMLSPRPMHGRSLSNGNAQTREIPSSRRLFGFLPHRTSEERAQNNRRKIENNPRGLTELYSPAEPQVDFVFVHGLRGGSVKTWCDDENLNLFWPKEWIAVDEDLRSRVRTSSFGYANDWLTPKASQLTLHDFGRDLIYQLDNSPYLRKEPHTPIVLIGHSMGGLVIKKACLLAHQQRKKIADRIKCIVFLATPHRGSSAAEFLKGLLDLTGSEKKFVEELCRDSSSLQIINDEFRHVAQSMHLRLTSLYETQGMMGSRLVVKEGSAVLGYDNEEVNMVFADHRSICKFKSPEDEAYRNLRNALLRITDDLTSESHAEMLQEQMEQMESLKAYLNIHHQPQCDLDQQSDRQIEQSCTWLERRPIFQVWLDGTLGVVSNPNLSPRLQKLQRRSTLPLSGRCNIHWLTGNPGAGKSVCAAHVITQLRAQKRPCAYHFFRTGEKAKTRVSSMLLSVAFQMAELHSSIRDGLAALQKARNSFDGDDDGAIWRKLFVNCILKAPLQKSQYWIIDAVDECVEVEKLFSKLNSLECAFDLRIFVTSRHSSKLESLFQKLEAKLQVTVDSIRSNGLETDMRLYLHSRLDCLPVDNPIERNAMVEKLICKANGSFLWLRCVSHELEGVFSEDSIDEVLGEAPLEMSELYGRAVETLLDLKRLGDRQVAEAVLTWCACTIRPLTLVELTTALNQYDGYHVANLEPVKKNGYKVTNLRAFIEGPFSGLLFADGRGCVQFVHATAREYVLEALKSRFDVTRAAGNEKLTMACLRCLVQELAASRNPSLGGRNPSLGGNDSVQTRKHTVFTSYASCAFSEHFAASSSRSHQLLQHVVKFLSKNALAWIEQVALEQPSLYPLTRAGKNFREFLRRRAKSEPPLGHDFSALDGWSTDLIRLVAKFGSNLRSNPSSIHNLIPLVAPKQSRLAQAVKDGPKWLELVGPASEDWDDCVCSIQYKDSWGTCVATGENIFAIGLKNGTIIVFDQSTCQEKFSVSHKLPKEMSQNDRTPPSTVRLLTFDPSDTKFASSSVHSVCVWAMDGDLLQVFSLQEPCVTLRFSIDQNELLCITRSSQVMRWSLMEDLEGEDDVMAVPAVQTRRLSSGSARLGVSTLPRQAPLAAAISPDQCTLAMLYRGRPIFLCSLEDDTIVGTCGRDVGSKTSNISVQTAIFNPNPELSVLAVAYQDGVLAIYDTWTQKELVSTDGDAYSLASTPDGRTLGTGNTRGTINLWDFETLSLLCSIRSGCDEIRSLAFSGDGLRVVDIRDSNTKVWESSALVRRAGEENASMSDAVALEAPVVGVNEDIVSITAMCSDDIGHLIYAGRDDGSVVSYEVSTGTFSAHVHSHAQGLFISAIAFREGTIGSADVGGRVIVQKLSSKPEQINGGSHLLQLDMMAPVQQLIFNDDASRLLVATARSKAILDVLGKRRLEETVEPPIHVNILRQWFRLGKSLGAVSQTSLELHPWNSTQPVSTIPLDTRSPIASICTTNCAQEILVQDYRCSFAACAFSCVGQTSLVRWSIPSSEHAVDELQNLQASSTDLQGLPVKTFLGVYSNSAVFLDDSLWVCSVKLGMAPMSNIAKVEIQRHFFVPSDFLRGSTACRPIVTNQGDVVFPKGNELAIVRGGLGWSFD